ncbi:MAG: hypothetical protein H6739_31425 [Alphaproteobacteria bacterium]|nr:hypothetical protein [Alphaproteobacteria bacterium]
MSVDPARPRPPAPLIFGLAAVGGVALGLPFAAGHPDGIALFIGITAVGSAAAAARRWGRPAGGVLALAAAVAMLTGSVGGRALDAWSNRVRRDTAEDARFRAEGVKVRAEPGYMTVAVGDGPDEYCATMSVSPRRSGLFEQTGIDATTVDGVLLASRCDLTPRLYERIAAAQTARREVTLIVLPELITDSYGRPALSGYRLPEELITGAP